MKDKTNYINHINLIQPLSQLLDITSVILSGMIAYYVRDFSVPVEPKIYMIAITIGALYTSIIFRLSGTYRSKNDYQIQNSLQKIIVSWALVLASLALTAYLTKTGEYYSRIWFVMWSIYGLFFLILIKVAFLSILYSNLFKRLTQKNIILVGTLKHSNLVARQLENSGFRGLNILGHINSTTQADTDTAPPLNNLGDLENINTILKNHNADEVWITLPLNAEETIKKILHLLRHNTINIRMIPDIFELRLLNQSITDIAGIPMINLCESPMSGTNKYLKFLEDIILSFIIIILCIPVFILISILIKFTSKGPVLYYQDRIGWNGKRFRMIKFRSMPVDAEKSSGPVWAKAGDNRATRFGAFLRRSSLDELPQLFNVLKGDMSLVGPRPERPEFVHEFKEQIPGYMKKHMVKAGITGWAQINGWRGDTDLTMRISHDLYYIENWSLMFDLKIIALTIVKGFTHANAY